MSVQAGCCQVSAPGKGEENPAPAGLSNARRNVQPNMAQVVSKEINNFVQELKGWPVLQGR